MQIRGTLKVKASSPLPITASTCDIDGKLIIDISELLLSNDGVVGYKAFDFMVPFFIFLQRIYTEFTRSFRAYSSLGNELLNDGQILRDHLHSRMPSRQV